MASGHAAIQGTVAQRVVLPHQMSAGAFPVGSLPGSAHSSSAAGPAVGGAGTAVKDSGLPKKDSITSIPETDHAKVRSRLSSNL